MSITGWLSYRLSLSGKTRSADRNPWRQQPRLEALEDRVLPSLTPHLLKDINPGRASSVVPGFRRPSAEVSGVACLVANDGVHGAELWKSNGTAAGTVLVKDINAGSAGSYPYGLTNVNGTLFFQADNGVSGQELWKSNGTAAGTVMVKDLNPGSASSLPRYLTNVNGTLFFDANNGVSGQELWKSNGTAAGTVMVKDINPGSAGSGPNGLTNVNGTLFFSANNGVSNVELWKSNGTAAGTVMVKDINPGSASSFPRYLTNVNGTLFFQANDGTHGKELWKSNGTPAGTVLVNSNPAVHGLSPTNLTNVNGTLFFDADDGVHGNEPWVLGPVPAAVSAQATAAVLPADFGIRGTPFTAAAAVSDQPTRVVPSETRPVILAADAGSGNRSQPGGEAAHSLIPVSWAVAGQDPAAAPDDSPAALKWDDGPLATWPGQNRKH